MSFVFTNKQTHTHTHLCLLVPWNALVAEAAEEVREGGKRDGEGGVTEEEEVRRVRWTR